MEFISYCLSLFLYNMSYYLTCYSVLHELNTLDAGGSRSMCGVIVVDAESFFGLLVTDVMLIFMIMPRYSHNYALFYQLLDSNLFTHRVICYLERSH